jgi:molybdenum cofactor cytidylyltransferase
MQTEWNDQYQLIANYAVSRAKASQNEAAVTPIVLAAGAGTRFSDVSHKLLASLPATSDRPAESVIERSIAAARNAELGELVVVTGRLTAHELGLHPDVYAAHNDAWARGQMTSVQRGINVARDNNSEVAVIGLADQPGIGPAAWQAVAEAALGGAPIAVATYAGRRANPVALHRDVWDLLTTAGDEGARSLMALRPELVREVPCTGSPTDIDTVEDLRRWQNN